MQQHGGVPELLIGLGYNGTTGRLTVEIVKGSHFRNLSLGKAPDTYVKLCLVSSMGQEIARSKTSTKRGQPNPLFKETFIFQVGILLCDWGIVHKLRHLEIFKFVDIIFENFSASPSLSLLTFFKNFTGCPFSIKWCNTDDFCVFKTKHEAKWNGRMVFFGTQFERSWGSATF